MTVLCSANSNLGLLFAAAPFVFVSVAFSIQCLLLFLILLVLCLLVCCRSPAVFNPLATHSFFMLLLHFFLCCTYRICVHINALHHMPDFAPKDALSCGAKYTI